MLVPCAELVGSSPATSDIVVRHGSYNKPIVVPQLRIECDVNESSLDCAKVVGICDTYGVGRYACDL